MGVFGVQIEQSCMPASSVLDVITETQHVSDIVGNTAGALAVAGNIVLGSAAGSQALTVHASTQHDAAVVVTKAFTALGTVVLGSSSGQTVTINSPAMFNAAVTAADIRGAAVQVAERLSMLRGSLLGASGSAIIGTDSKDSLTVHGTTTFTSGVIFEGSVTFPNGTSITASSNTTLGTTAEDSLTVNAGAVFRADLRVEGELEVDIMLNATGSTVLGSSSSDYLTVNAATIFAGPVALYSGGTVLADAAVAAFRRRLGTGAGATGTVLGRVLFTGWDGATDGSAAQIRSVFTVTDLAFPVRYKEIVFFECTSCA